MVHVFVFNNIMGIYNNYVYNYVYPKTVVVFHFVKYHWPENQLLIENVYSYLLLYAGIFHSVAMATHQTSMHSSVSVATVTN